MKRVTIFSTKTLTDKGCLFDGCTTKRYSKDLFDYFTPSIADLVRICIKNKLIDDVKTILLNVEDKVPLPKDDEKIIKGKPVEKVFETHIEFEIRYASSDEEPEKFDELCKRIEMWNQKPQLLELLEKKNCKEILDIKNRATFLQLEDTEVYAIRCLGDGEKKSEEWITALVMFAKSLGDEIELNLVLHDKDLGATYDKPDPPTIISEANVKNVFKDINDILHNIQCRIAFFQHTTNSFVDILNEGFSKKRNIHEEVESACKRYSCGLDYLVKMSESNIQDYGIDVFTENRENYNEMATKDSSIHDEFQSYELLEAINNRTKQIIKTLTE